ncbi:hypothetical protein H4I96_11676 [Botrytis cinerea]
MNSNGTDNYYVGITSKKQHLHQSYHLEIMYSSVSIAFFFIIIFAIAIQNVRARIISNKRSMDEQRRVEEGRMTKAVQKVTGGEKADPVSTEPAKP